MSGRLQKYNSIIPQKQTIENLFFQSACEWLSRGFDLLPVQPGTKYLHSGFGRYQNRLRTIDACHCWFADDHKNNLAVVCNGENFILDFDDHAVFTIWARSADEKFTTSYTEWTPRGVHVFLCGPVPTATKLISGVEIKRVCLVAPSVVNGVEYIGGVGPIAKFEENEFDFSSLSALELKPATAPRQTITRGDADLIADIKKSIRCEDVLARYAPRTFESLHGAGRFRSARCPFHKAGMEVKNSFWIDTELNTWGCHAESITGDVINLYGLLAGVTNQRAIKDLLFESQQVGAR